MDSLKLVSLPLPAGPPHLTPAELQSWAGEMGAHSLPISSFISWKGIRYAPSPMEKFSCDRRSQSPMGQFISLLSIPRSVYYSG